MFSLIQISDTHLSELDPVGHAGWGLAAAYIDEVRPALVVNTGDIVRDDPSASADHAFARARHDALPVEWCAVPGNHDIGDGLPNIGSIDEELRMAFDRNYGPGYWQRDFESWRLLGISDLLFDTGSTAEAAQWQWLEGALGSAAGKQLALFLHKPPFLLSPDENRTSSMTVPQRGGDRLWRLVEAHDVRLIACGHRHEHRTMRIGAVTIVWAPTTSALLEDRTPPEPRIKPTPGLVEYLFVDQGFIHSFIPLNAFGGQR